MIFETVRLVGASGFEPPTSWSRTRRSSQAEPRPEFDRWNTLVPAALRPHSAPVHPAINREFSITLGSPCRIGRGARQGSSGNMGRIRSSAARKTAPGTIGGVAGTRARCLLNARKQRGCHCALRNARVGLRMGSTHTARSRGGIHGRSTSRSTFRLAGSVRQGRAVDPSAGLIRDFDVRFLRSSRFRMP